MNRITFGHAIDRELLSELAGVVASELGSDVRDLFYLGPDRSILSSSGRFAYDAELIRGRSNPDETVSFSYQPDRASAAQCLVLIPIDRGFLGVVLAHGTDPARACLCRLCTKLLIHRHLDRIREGAAERTRSSEMHVRHERWMNELEGIRSEMERAEERARSIGEGIEAAAHETRADAGLLGTARACREELGSAHQRLNQALTMHARLMEEIEELRAVCVPRMAEDETLILDLRERLGRVEREREAVAAALAASLGLEAPRQPAALRPPPDASPSLEGLRSEHAMADLVRRAGQAEEEAVKIKHSVDRLTESTRLLKASLAEEQLRLMKFDGLLNLIVDISLVSSDPGKMGLDPAEALESIRRRLSSLL